MRGADELACQRDGSTSRAVLGEGLGALRPVAWTSPMLVSSCPRRTSPARQAGARLGPLSNPVARAPRVLMVQDSFFPAIGGAEIHVANLARSLRSLGHQVTIVTTTPGPGHWEGFTVHRFPALEGGGRRCLVRLPAHLPRLYSLVAEHDVVHCHFTFFCSAVLAVVNAGRRPLIVTLHGLGTLDSSVSNRPGKRLFRWLSLKAADRILATSAELAAVAWRTTSAEKVAIVPNGVDTKANGAARTGGGTLVTDRSPQRRSVGEGPVEVTVVAVRRLDPKNGVQYLVEAAPELLRLLGPSLRVRIVGDGPLMAYLRDRAHQLHVGGVVEFLGSLPNEQALAVIDSADVAVLPSSAESSSIAALEAMGRGKPVVASAVGALPELLGWGRRGLLVPLFDRATSDYAAPLTLPPERISALAHATARVALDRDLAERLGRAAQDYVRAHHDWSTVARQVAGSYQEALAHRGRSRLATRRRKEPPAARRGQPPWSPSRAGAATPVLGARPGRLRRPSKASRPAGPLMTRSSDDVKMAQLDHRLIHRLRDMLD